MRARKRREGLDGREGEGGREEGDGEGESERDTEGRGMTERKSTTGERERERGSRPTTLLFSIYYCLVLVLVPFGFYYFKVPRLSL